MSDYLSNLPTVDNNALIQDRSFVRLQGLLPPDRFGFRDVTSKDYGVDATLELRINNSATNFFAQAQVKGSESIAPNKDGSYSFQIDTSNLHYLLNGRVGIYFLHDQKQDKLFYVFASDEIGRIEGITPDWSKQKTIVLRFVNELDEAALALIEERILNEGKFDRSVRESIRVDPREIVSVSVNSKTLEVAKPDELFKMFSVAGVALVNEGYGEDILRQIPLLSEEQQNTSEIQTVVAYANYMSGRYRSALDAAHNVEKSDANVEWLIASCSFELGLISFAGFSDILTKVSEGEESEKFSAVRFDALRRRVLSGDDDDARDKAFEVLKSEYDKLGEDEKKTAAGRRFLLVVLQTQLNTLTLRASRNILTAVMKLRTGEDIDLAAVMKDDTERFQEWEMAADEFFVAGTNQEQIQITIDKANYVYLLSNISRKAVALAPGKIESDSITIEEVIVVVEKAREVASETKERRALISIDIVLGGLLLECGRADEAKEKLGSAIVSARKMGASNLEASANALLREIDSE